MFGELNFVAGRGPLRNVSSSGSLALWSMANFFPKIVGKCLTPKINYLLWGFGPKRYEFSRESSEKGPKNGSDSAK